MKIVKFLGFLCITAMIGFNIPQSWSQELNQEKDYQRAQTLLGEGKLEEALVLLKKLSTDNPSGLKFRLGLINAKIEKARVLKVRQNPAWKKNIYQAFDDLKSIYRANRTSPELYLSFAKCYWLINQPRKTELFLRKAFYFNPGYIEAYIFRGNINLENGQKIKNFVGESEKDDFEDNKKDFEDNKRRARDSYLKLLSAPDIDGVTKGLAHYKLGKTYYDLYQNKRKASKQWKMAVSVSPESLWGKKAQERLNALK